MKPLKTLVDESSILNESPHTLLITRRFVLYVGRFEVQPNNWFGLPLYLLVWALRIMRCLLHGVEELISRKGLAAQEDSPGPKALILMNE